MKTARLILLAAAAVLSVGATKPAPKPAAAAKGNWTATVVRTPADAVRVGNPNARVKVIEYVSYTCSSCSRFEMEASSELALGFIRPGTGSVEYRPYFRNEIDIAATLMALCGPVDKFTGNHALLLRSQANWNKSVSREQQQRWIYGEFGDRMRAIATDLKLYDLFQQRGYDRPTLDRCLNDRALADRLARENTVADDQIGITGTPSFLINGKLQPVHDWASLRKLLLAATR
ncbi:thioredoxin domain-containing protein [Novosphingobium sp. TH158]|uniref:DsbA family protein n=1 Tax=Novosphingobium sp. TH158 TaxID=2067455 RepID=UPI000C7B9E77|nr:thioredoxin domain-containing protein [Novosphingobium sp. TH158]PLK26545.1 protein-disulfide isomerase [Novosphingobium sp. TH158]